MEQWPIQADQPILTVEVIGQVVRISGGRAAARLRRDEHRWILRGRVQNVRLALGHERGRCLTQVGCPIAAFVAPGLASFLARSFPARWPSLIA
jgi:hypothetical protein